MALISVDPRSAGAKSKLNIVLTSRGDCTGCPVTTSVAFLHQDLFIVTPDKQRVDYKLKSEQRCRVYMMEKC